MGLTGGAHQGKNTVRGRFSHQDKLTGECAPCGFSYMLCYVPFNSNLLMSQSIVQFRKKFTLLVVNKFPLLVLHCKIKLYFCF